ncbi:hypothetical protein Agub_g9466, partial [Astrephomene gubernaculifera]
MAAAVTIRGPGFNPFGRVWAAYERSLRRRPLLTQAVSTAALWGLGDCMAQRIETRGRGGVDARRAALTAAFGGIVIGPAGHFWYILLERLVLRMGLVSATKSMLVKVALDNLIYNPCYVLSFFAYGCLVIDRLSLPEFADQLREQFMPTMLAEAAVWPPYMAAVFSRVPVQHQLLAVNVATLFDVCFLSWMRTNSSSENHQAELAIVQGKKKKKQQRAQLSTVGKKKATQVVRNKSETKTNNAFSTKGSSNSNSNSVNNESGVQHWFTSALLHLSQQPLISQQQPQQPPPRS